ncbi:MAG: sugar phosphate isomerase/epimerase [Clostridia bacterium]|nr:sugar phosphate isomerase/epimerase [Clostridia bacterium]
MHRVLCSTGTLLGRPNGRNYNLLLSLEKELQCDGLELMFYDTWYDQVDALSEVIGKLHLPIVAFHGEKNICASLVKEETFSDALKKFTVNCQLASAFHAEKMVFHLWDGWMDDTAIETALSKYEILNGIAKEYGVTLTIENIVCAQKDPLHYCKKLLNMHPETAFTYDTKMAAFHRQETTLYEPDRLPFAKQIRHLHMNDYNGGYMDWPNFKTLHPGEGIVDFETFFSFLKEIGYTGDFTTEATSFDKTGTIHLDKLNKTLQTLREYIKYI